jgi:hypothetical protein
MQASKFGGYGRIRLPDDLAVRSRCHELSKISAAASRTATASSGIVIIGFGTTITWSPGVIVPFAINASRTSHAVGSPGAWRLLERARRPSR